MKNIIALLIVFGFNLNLKAHHGLEGSVGMNGSLNTGLTTLKKGQFYFDLSQFVWQYRSLGQNWYSIPNVLDLNVAQSTNLQGMYGISNSLTIGFQAMYNFNTYTPLFGEVEDYTEQSFNGLGDVSLFLTQRLYKHDGFEMAVIAGAELPIGAPGVKEGAILTTAGSRSFDPFAGIILNQKFDHFKFRNQFIYKITTENQDGYNFGNMISNEFFIDYSFKEDHHSDSTQHKVKDLQLNLLLGHKFEDLDQNSRNESFILNTGFIRTFGTLGVRLSYKDKLFLPITVDIPIHESLIGIQNESSVRFQVGLGLLL